MDGEHADDLLRRALIDADAAASVALRVTPLVLSEALTVVFHGRKDLGTIQTYVAHGGRGAGDAVGKDELMRVPCDLDLAAAEDRAEAEHLFAEQAGALRDALVGADTVLDIWREPLEDLAHDRIRVDRRINLNLRLPAHRLLPTALVAPEKQIVVTAVCSARPLAEGRPPMGIACAQQDVVRVYPLPDDPERCLNDFLELAADHARSMAEQIGRQEASVQRFLELSGEDFPADRLASPAALRRTRILIIAGFGIFVFLGISAMLARALSATGTERSRVLEVVQRRGAGRRAAPSWDRRPPARRSPPAWPRRDVRRRAQAARATSRSSSTARRSRCRSRTASAPAAWPGAPARPAPSSSASASAAKVRCPARASSCSRSPRRSATRRLVRMTASLRRTLC